MVLHAPRNEFVGAGHSLTRPYKSISELIYKNNIFHRVVNDCVVWWRRGYARGGKPFEPLFTQMCIFRKKIVPRSRGVCGGGWDIFSFAIFKLFYLFLFFET